MLPSKHDPLSFTATVSVAARWTGTGTAPPALIEIAREGITRRAEVFSARRAVTATERLRGELDVELLHWDRVADTDVHARGHCVSVDADAECVAAVAIHEATERRHTVLSWQGEQRARQAEHMRSLILDPLRATASWLMDNQDKQDKVVTIARQFQELRDILGSEERVESAGCLLDELLDSTTRPQRERAIRVLEKLFDANDRLDLLDRLVRADNDDAS